jgi:hypothetical protein
MVRRSAAPSSAGADLLRIGGPCPS